MKPRHSSYTTHRMWGTRMNIRRGRKHRRIMRIWAPEFWGTLVGIQQRNIKLIWKQNKDNDTLLLCRQNAQSKHKPQEGTMAPGVQRFLNQWTNDLFLNDLCPKLKNAPGHLLLVCIGFWNNKQSSPAWSLSKNTQGPLQVVCRGFWTNKQTSSPVSLEIIRILYLLDNMGQSALKCT